MDRKGIVLAGGTGSRLFPLTISVSKQLMPVYDKPMIYYPLSVLMLADIREILIISTPDDLPLFRRLLGDGSWFGVKIEYAVQESPDGLAQAFTIAGDVGFLHSDPVALVLGDNLFYGANLVDSLKQASQREAGATIFGYQVNSPEEYGVVEFSADGNVISIEEKPSQPKSDYAVPGLYFYDSKVLEYAKTLRPSARGELEITDLNRIYLESNSLSVELLGRGTAWLDTGSHEALLQAGQFVEVIEQRQGLKIACLEEIAWSKKWITQSTLQARVESLGKSSYAKYLRRFLK